MITIKIGGKPLYIPKDTVIVLEQHNYILSEEEPAGDIVWTFEVPAEQNAELLGSERYIYVSGHRRYECEVMFDGSPISKGELYVQSSKDEKTLSCGIVANAFGIGFGEKMLNENNYGNDITIATSASSHKSQWVAFLKDSLKEHSIVKFMLFADEKFYKDNEDFGFFKGNASNLTTYTDEDLFTKFVNRLFFDEDGNVIQNAASSRQGVRVFNEASVSLRNGYVFAPAIRLDWLMRQVMKNAGLKLYGDWVANKNIQRLFVQSLNALDGDVFQYGANTYLSLSGSLNEYTDDSDMPHLKYEYNNEAYNCFGWRGSVNFAFRALLPVDELEHGGEAVKQIPYPESIFINSYDFKAKKTDEIYAFCIRTENADRPSIRMKQSWKDGSGSEVFAYGRWSTNEELIERAGVNSNGVVRDIVITGNGNCRIWYEGTLGSWPVFSTHSFTFYTETNSMLIQLTRSKSNNILYTGEFGSYTEGNVTPGWKPSGWSSTTRLFIELVKCTIGSTDGELKKTSSSMDNDIDAGDWGDIESITDYEVQESIELDTTDDPLNIFSNVLRWKDHVPDLSNGEFISKICQLFGLNLFANPMTKEVQLSFFANIFKAKCFDISQWVYSKERLSYDPKEYDIMLESSLGGNDISEENIINDVASKDELSSPIKNKVKHVFVKNENAYRKSTKEDNSSRFNWEQAGGDNRKLIAGTIGETKEDVSISANVPNMKWIDGKRKEKYICELTNDGCSRILDEEYDGKFDFVIQQYRGHRHIQLQNSNAPTNNAYIEDGNPTIYDEHGNVIDNCINLSAVGDRSIGEMWLKPLYDFKGKCETFRFVANLPGWAFIKMMTLLQPQIGNTSQQLRWIMVGNQRFLPTKISYELGYKDSVTTTIECAAPHVEV